jgi:prepilin peptidase CpaA
MTDVSQALTGIAAMLLAVAAVHDAATRTIPNWVPTVLAALGVAVRLLGGQVLPGLAAAGLILAGCVLAWLGGWLGGGDAKLAAAFALVLPPGQVAAFVLATALAGGVLALLYLLLHRVVPPPAPGRRSGLLPRCLKAETWRISRGGPLPYAVAIAAGGFYVLQPLFGIG